MRLGNYSHILLRTSIPWFPSLGDITQDTWRRNEWHSVQIEVNHWKCLLFSSQVYSKFPYSTHASQSWWSSEHHCDLGTPVSTGNPRNPSLSSSFPGRVCPRRQSEWMIKMLLLLRATNWVAWHTINWFYLVLIPSASAGSVFLWRFRDTVPGLCWTFPNWQPRRNSGCLNGLVPPQLLLPGLCVY